MDRQESKSYLDNTKGFLTWILSRAFDIFPIKQKVYILTKLTHRFSERLLFSGKSRIIKWQLPLLSNEVKLKVSNQDDYFALLVRGEIETWEQETLKAWIQATKKLAAEKIVIDVGAYFGLFSIIAASGKGAGKIIAIEPNPNTLPKLRYNIKLNNCQTKIEVAGKACGSHRSTLKLMIPKGRKTSSGAQMELSELNDKTGWENAGMVEVVPLDDFVQAQEISRIAAIKIDAEGFEMKVLSGAQGILMHSKPVIIVEILEYGLLLKVTEFLQQFGYSTRKPLDGYLLNSENPNGVSNSDIARNYLFT